MTLSRNSRPFLNLILFIYIALCSGCSSTAILAQRGSYLRAYHNGCLEQAEQNLSCIVEQEIPQNRYTQSKNATWILLDRATTRFVMGKTEEAIQDYAAALESMDYYRQELSAERFAQVMLQDETGAYQADDFEHVLARLYFAFALLHQGDESNAYALLRQAEEFQQEQRALYAKIPFTRCYRLKDNGLSKYLFATLLEKRGDITNANILYSQAAELTCNTEVFQTKEKNQATLLILCHNGNAPYKISEVRSGSVISAAAMEILLTMHDVDPACSSLMGIPVPALRSWPYSNPQPTYATVDGIKKPILPFYSVCQDASEQLEQKMPVIVARGASRLLVRRGAVGYIGRQNSDLGVLADMAMCAINSQTRADTRSWTTLPAFIDLARYNLDAGLHQINIQVFGEGQETAESRFCLNLKPNDLCVIHVFNIHPGITQILIPNRYLINQGKSL